MAGSADAGGVAHNFLGGAYKTDAPELKQRELRYYCSFDVGHFVANPRAETERFHTVEPSYWNHLAKSSLLGTRNRGWLTFYEGFVPSERIAIPMTYLLLGLISLLGLGAIAAKPGAARRRAYTLLVAAVFIASGLAFHLLVPTAHHNDFRFIFPVVIAISLLFVFAAEGLQRFKLRLLAYAGAFMVVSLAYFAPVPSLSAMFEAAADTAPRRCVSPPQSVMIHLDLSSFAQRSLAADSSVRVAADLSRRVVPPRTGISAMNRQAAALQVCSYCFGV